MGEVDASDEVGALEDALVVEELLGEVGAWVDASAVGELDGVGELDEVGALGGVGKLGTLVDGVHFLEQVVLLVVPLQ